MDGEVKRKNLTLETHAHVKRLVSSGNKLDKVEYQKRGKDLTVKARREIIVCAGAVNSPQLLELSGIGDPDRLSSLGISPIQSQSGLTSVTRQDKSGTAIFNCP